MAGTIHCRSKAGIMAVWLGRFPDPEDFYRYVQICYRSENEEEWDPAYIFSPAVYQRRLDTLFRPENRDRPEEEALRRAFQKRYSVFEYDYGILIDGDFAVCDYCDKPSADLTVLMDEWPEIADGIADLVKKSCFAEEVNCLFAVPSCEYTGSVIKSQPEGGTLWFIGNMQESIFSDSVAEDYNIQAAAAADPE